MPRDSSLGKPGGHGAVLNTADGGLSGAQKLAALPIMSCTAYAQLRLAPR